MWRHIPTPLFGVPDRCNHRALPVSSSAKQLSTRQGVGKVKHVAGKLLWIQDAVLRKQVMLIQVPTLWNLSDLGTKPLGAKHLRLLLHELGVSTHEGEYVVGQAEYEQHSSRHGGGKEMAVLAMNIARVLVVMGLGPMLGTGMTVDDDETQCSLTKTNGQPTTDHDRHGFGCFWFSCWSWLGGQHCSGVCSSGWDTFGKATKIFVYRWQSWMPMLGESEQIATGWKLKQNLWCRTWSSWSSNRKWFQMALMPSITLWWKWEATCVCLNWVPINGGTCIHKREEAWSLQMSWVSKDTFKPFDNRIMDSQLVRTQMSEWMKVSKKESLRMILQQMTLQWQLEMKDLELLSSTFYEMKSTMPCEWTISGTPVNCRGWFWLSLTTWMLATFESMWCEIQSCNRFQTDWHQWCHGTGCFIQQRQSATVAMLWLWGSWWWWEMKLELAYEDERKCEKREKTGNTGTSPRP